MATCCYIKEDGNKCTLYGNDLPYFWFHDAFELVNQEFKLCQHHSNVALGKLMKDENDKTQQISLLRLKLKTEKRVKKMCGVCNLELVENFSKCPRCGADTWNSKKIITIEDRQTKNDTWAKIKSLNSILNFIRNKKCRLCNHPLFDPNCKQCEERQTGKKYSHADFKSPVGARRVDCRFHVKCGRIWLQALTGKQLLETKNPQTRLFLNN